MASFATTVREVMNLHRAQLAGIVEQRGVGRMRRIYDEARAELQAKLDAMIARRRGDTFTAQHYRLLLAQIHDGIRVFGGRMEGHLLDTGELAGTVAHRHLIQEIKKFEGAFSGMQPVIAADQIGVYRRVWQDVEPSLLIRHRRSVQLYGRPTVEAIHKQLAVSLAQGETLDQTVGRVAATDGTFAGERWRAERIARTETAYSYGAVKQRSMEETAVQMPGLMKKLVETMDDRTGDDSKILNGQTQPVGKPFVYHPPAGEKGYPPFMSPPGRPNDRACSVPWRPGWGDPAGVADAGPVDPTVPAP